MLNAAAINSWCYSYIVSCSLRVCGYVKAMLVPCLLVMGRLVGCGPSAMLVACVSTAAAMMRRIGRHESEHPSRHNRNIQSGISSAILDC